MLLLYAPQTFIKNRGYYRRGLFAQMTSTRRNKKSRFITVVKSSGENSRRYSWIYLGFPISRMIFFSSRGVQRATWEEKSFLHWRVQCDNTVSCDSLFRVSNFPAIFNRSPNMNEKNSSGISQHATPGS